MYAVESGADMNAMFADHVVTVSTHIAAGQSSTVAHPSFFSGVLVSIIGDPELTSLGSLLSLVLTGPAVSQ